MTIAWRAINGTSFLDALYNFLVPMEAPLLNQRLYPTLVNGNVTIGVGFDLKAGGSDVQDAVFKAMGLDPSIVDLGSGDPLPVAGTPQAVEYQYVQALRAAISIGDIGVLQGNMALRADQYANDPQYASYIDSLDVGAPQAYFGFSNDTVQRQVFDNLWTNYYEQKLLDAFPALRTDAAFRNSNEMIALASLMWNGPPPGSPNSLIGPKLINAINNGDRAEAWYEIRYNSNGDGQHTNRRYQESDQFTLYNTSAIESDYKAAYRTFTRHKQAILDYEGTYNPANAGSTDINGRLAIAYEHLTQAYGISGIPIDWQNIFVGEDQTNSWRLQIDSGWREDDRITGTDQNDLIFGESGLDVLHGGSGNDVIYGGDDADILYGEGNNDVLIGGEGSDIFEGGQGNDRLEGGQGNDAYIYNAGDGNDTIFDADGNGSVVFSEAFLNGGKLTDSGSYVSDDSRFQYTFTGDLNSGGTLVVTDIAGSITINNFKNGNLGITLRTVDEPPPPVSGQVLYYGDGNYVVVTGRGDDRITVGAGQSVVIAGDGNNTVTLGAGAHTVFAGSGFDSIRVSDGDQLISSGSGDDQITVGNGNSTVYAGDGDDQITLGTTGVDGSDYNYGIYAGAGNDTITFNSYFDQLVLTDDNAGTGNDTFIFNSAIADLTLSVEDGDDGVYGKSFSGQVVLGDGNNTARFSGGPSDFLITAGSGNDYINVSSANNGEINVGDGNNTVVVYGNNVNVQTGNGDDSFAISGANITIDAGSGNDNFYLNGGNAYIDAGTGNNSFVVASSGGYSIVAGDGNDTVSYWQLNDNGNGSIDLGDGTNLAQFVGFAGSYSLTTGSGVDTIVLGQGSHSVSTGGGDDSVNILHYSQLSNHFVDTGDGNDTMEIWFGSHTLFLGAGADFLDVRDADSIYVDAGDGANRLQISANQATVVSGAGSDYLSWSEYLNSELDASLGEGHNILNVAGDTLRAVTESGNDSATIYHVVSTGFFDLGDGNNYIELVSGTATNFQVITGVGADTILIGGGSDSYDIRTGGGNDIISVENWGGSIVIGNSLIDAGAGDDRLLLDGGDNFITGGIGNDQITGGIGNDTYFFYRGDGQDRILDRGSMEGVGDAIQLGADISRSDISAGRSGDNLIIHINDTADQLTVFNFYSGQTYKIERVVFGDGTVWNSTALENLGTVRGTSSTDTLTGTMWEDTLFGLAGNDILAGGAGSDTYVFNLGDGIDTVIDLSASGDTNVISFGAGIDSASLTLGLGSLLIRYGDQGDAIHIQNFDPNNVYKPLSINEFHFADGTVLSYADLISRGFDLAGTDGDDVIIGTSVIDRIAGGAGNDILIGEAGSDRLDGGTGADTMAGGFGDDVYVVDNSGDIVTENYVNEGIDTVYSSITYALPDNVDNLTLTGTDAIDAVGNSLYNVLIGNVAQNTLEGGGGNDYLDGGAGADTLIGGAGADTYVVDDVGDVVIDKGANRYGVDRLYSSVTYTLPSSVEWLTLTGTADIDGTGNRVNNWLVGNSGNNTLDGGANDDLMEGGLGDDTYVVDDVGDWVTEYAGEGNDSIQSSIDYSLSTYIENLTLIGRRDINGAGNGFDNVLIGNSGKNTLSSYAGNDYLDGGIDADILIGGTGNDTYVFNRGYGADVIQEDDATPGNTDTVQVGEGPTNIVFARSGQDLVMSLHGARRDALTVQNWYAGTQHQTEQFKTADGSTLLNYQVELLIQAMATFSAQNGGITWDQAIDQRPDDVQAILAANWQTAA